MRQGEIDDDNAAPPNRNEDEAPAAHAPPHLAIQDEEDWIRQNGLGQHADYGQESLHNVQEARHRVQAEQSYEQQVHERLFSDQFQEQQISDARVKQQQLDEWKDESIHVLTSSCSSPYTVNLGQFARSSDTVFALAKSRPHYEASDDRQQLQPLSLSLLEYPDEAVQVFLEVIQVKDHSQQVSAASTIPSEHMVTCCHLAHYLQCTDILDKIVSILQQSIDSANCLPLCQLADQLQLHELLEWSLNHMMRTLGDLQEREVWGDLNPELQSRIRTIQTLLQGGHKIYFSSFHEYLAILAEQVDYYKERLQDAERAQELHAPEQNRDSSRGYEYAQEKIDKQQLRVQTLELVLMEHKKLFASKGMLQDDLGRL